MEYPLKPDPLLGPILASKINNMRFAFALLFCAEICAFSRASATESPARVGEPLATYCARYLLGLVVSYEDYSNYLPLYRAAVEVSAKAHTNAEQTVGADGRATYRVFPAADQTYGGDRYTVHLAEVESVLRRFGYSPRTSAAARILRIAARLHDTAEDTPIGLAEIEAWFGKDIASLVDAVKKVSPSTKSDSAEVKRAKLATIAKVKSHRFGTTLKLADRIANVEKGIRSGRILPKYIDDYPIFREELYAAGENEAMWAYLDGLIRTQKFPPGTDYWSLRLSGLDYAIRPELSGKFYQPSDIRLPKEALPEFASVTESVPKTLDLNEIHFMQGYVHEHIGHKKYSLIETAQDLKTGDLRAEDLPAVTVWKDTAGKIWTLDHRRVAAMRLSGKVQKVNVRWASADEVAADAFKFDPWAEGKKVQILLEDGRVVVPN